MSSAVWVGYVRKPLFICLFVYGVLGEHLLRGYFWLHTQILFLEILGGTIQNARDETQIWPHTRKAFSTHYIAPTPRNIFQ